MHGIEIKSGVNNCRWNIGGKCTCPLVTNTNLPPGYSRYWDSTQNCTLTILGCHVCSQYRAQRE